MQKVKSVHLDNDIRKGLLLILNVLIEDFDNGFEQLFPEANDYEVTIICKAIEWLNQHTDWKAYE